MNADDHRHMARARALAGRGLYSTDPTPRVGCALVQGGEVVGEGWHGRAGEPHAEAWALRAAGGRARGATAYVTLEPCCHHGRTPPCTDALIAAGVTRVVAAMIDPNPLMGGKGMAALAAAGIAVESGSMTAGARGARRYSPASTPCSPTTRRSTYGSRRVSGPSTVAAGCASRSA